jgi:hypothetical protein
VLVETTQYLLPGGGKRRVVSGLERCERDPRAGELDNRSWDVVALVFV